MLINFFDSSIFLNASLFVFFLGLIGLIINRYNLIIPIICVEIMFFGINYFLAASSISIQDMDGLVVCLFILTIAATESAIALGLLVIYYRIFKNVILPF